MTELPGIGFDLIEIERLERAIERRPRLARAALQRGRARVRRGATAPRAPPGRALRRQGGGAEGARARGHADARDRGRGRRRRARRRLRPAAASAAEAAREAGVSLSVSLTHSRELAAAAVVARPRRSDGRLARAALRRRDACGPSTRGRSRTRAFPRSSSWRSAGRAVAEAALEVAGDGPARIVCGKGNNGGDGLVAARHLAAAGMPTDVPCCCGPADELSGDAAANLDRLRRRRAPGRARRELEGALRGSGVVVDAIFGTGFSGAPREPAAPRSRRSTPVAAPVVAADIASGVDASTGEVAGAAVDADLTVSFHAAKLGQWIAPGKRHRGELRVVAIGIPPGDRPRPAAGLIRTAVLDLASRRGPDSTKFTSGEVLIVGGSRGLTGAVCMASEAAARAGAGYATVAVPARPRAHPRGQADRGDVDRLPVGGRTARPGRPPSASSRPPSAPPRWSSGPGFGRGDGARRARRRARAPDRGAAADRRRRPQRDRGLARAARRASARRRCSPRTPASSPGCSRPTRPRSAPIAWRHATEAASRSGAVVVLKGDDTIVASPDQPADRQRALEPGARDGGHRRRAQRDDRRDARPRPRAARRRRGRRPRPHAGRPGRRRARRRARSP